MKLGFGRRCHLYVVKHRSVLTYTGLFELNEAHSKASMVTEWQLNTVNTVNRL